MWGLFLTVASAFVIALALVLWRIWPALRGRVTDNDSIQSRVDKWNRYVAPLFRRHLGEELLVARANWFESKVDGDIKTITTWALEPTVLPDAQHVAIAHSPKPDAPIEIAGFISAEALRDLLVDKIQPQTMFGHTAWICVWPEDMTISDLDGKLMPVTHFRSQHGFDEDQEGDTK